MMTSAAMKDMLDRKLRDKPRLRRRLVQDGNLEDFKALRVQGAMETQRFMMAGVAENDLNGQAMVREFVREELLDLSAFDDV